LTEIDWFHTRSYLELSGELSVLTSPQPLLLLGAAFLRRAWEWLPSESWRLAVETTERFARRRTSRSDLIESWVNAAADTGEGPWRPTWYSGCPCCEPPWDSADAEIAGQLRPDVNRVLADPAWFAAGSAFSALRALVDGSVCRENDPRWVEERRAQFDLYRDIATAPGGLPDVTPFVRSSATLAGMVRAVDRQEELDRLDLLALADALEDAGCAERALLDHCRGPIWHGRGCWALEHLTGRAARPLPGR
jgi:hypothetical protein